MRENESLNLATWILEQKGFQNIRILKKPYDIEAEKDGFEYAIEVKGSDISYTVSWRQLRQAYFDHFLLEDHRVLLMFVTEKGNYCIFRMTDALIV